MRGKFGDFDYERIREARDLLRSLPDCYDEAMRAFAFPDLTGDFNWAHDWFDQLAAGNQHPVLVIVQEDGSRLSVSFDEIRLR